LCPYLIIYIFSSSGGNFCSNGFIFIIIWISVCFITYRSCTICQVVFNVFAFCKNSAIMYEFFGDCFFLSALCLWYSSLLLHRVLIHFYCCVIVE
jgi:hypothetical protein